MNIVCVCVFVCVCVCVGFILCICVYLLKLVCLVTVCVVGAFCWVLPVSILRDSHKKLNNVGIKMNY